MRKSVSNAFRRYLLLTAVAILSLPWQAVAQEKTPPPPKLKVGDAAPDFKLQYFTGSDLKDVTLNDYKGKNVVLAFYIFAFTGG
jgi:AhpC/TSA family